MNGQDKSGNGSEHGTVTGAAMTATEFADMVAAYGADTKRWPASKRAAAEALVSGDPIVRISLNEADALDRILAAAPAMSAARDAVLADRIVRAALHSPRLVAQGGAQAPNASTLAKLQPVVSRTPSGGAAWQGAALLAASLLMGVFVGQTDLSGRTLPALVEMAGLSLDQAGLDHSHIDHVDED
jgi:hypothetical protein